MTDLTTGEAVDAYLREHSNWGRWGDDDELGALEPRHPSKRMDALGLVRSGQTLSLSRPVPLTGVGGDPAPAALETILVPRDPDAGSVIDRLTITCHNTAVTHIDALCHIWDSAGNWNGRRSEDIIEPGGVNFGSVEAFRDGIITRGLLFDVPAHRGTDYVTQDRPVTGAELEEIATASGIVPSPGMRIHYRAGNPRLPFAGTRICFHGKCRNRR